jgi:hypothetical protein
VKIGSGFKMIREIQLKDKEQWEKLLQVAQIKKVLVRLVAGVGFEPTTFRL